MGREAAAKETKARTSNEVSEEEKNHDGVSPWYIDSLTPRLGISQHDVDTVDPELVLGDLESNVPPLLNLVSKIVNHCNDSAGNKVRLNMKAMLRIVEVEARAKGCWKEKEKWTATSVQELIDGIRSDFLKKYLGKSNRQNEASWSTVYSRMSNQGVFKAFPTKKKRHTEIRNSSEAQGESMALLFFQIVLISRVKAGIDRNETRVTSSTQ